MSEKIYWRTEKRRVEELKPFEGNPRRAGEKEYQDLKTSLEKFDIAEPLVINTDGTVIGGNFRLRILKDKGIQEIDVRIPSRTLTREEAEELNLRLNKNQGLWDYDLLANFNEDLLKDVGFSSEELDEIFGLEIDDDFDVEKEVNKVLENKERRCKEGDLWQLGEHRLYIGNATDRKSWEKVLGEERFDFLFTDPPYKIQANLPNSKKGFGSSQKRKYVSTAKQFPYFNMWLSLAYDFRNPIGSNIMIFENWRNLKELWLEIENYWKIKNLIIWHTPNRNYGYSTKAFFNKYDIVLRGEDGNKNLNLDDEGGLGEEYYAALYGALEKYHYDKHLKGSKYFVSDHIIYPVTNSKSAGNQNIIFGTKPIQILVPYIKILSPRNGIVVDCFGGSGSTLIACEVMKRKCRVIEIEPIYGEVLINRWEKFTGQTAKKLN